MSYNGSTGFSSMVNASYVYGSITICVDARRTLYCCRQLLRVSLDERTKKLCQDAIDSINAGQKHVPESVRAVIENKYRDIILGMRIRGVDK